MKGTFIFLILFLAGCQPAERSAITINKATIEYLTNPNGLDVESPRFSWTLESGKRGAGQTSYQIIVSKNSSEVANGRGEIWVPGNPKAAGRLM